MEQHFGICFLSFTGLGKGLPSIRHFIQNQGCNDWMPDHGKFS